MTTQTLTLTTGLAPYGGNVSVSPFSGYFLETNFTFGISNWVSLAKYAPI